MAALAELLPLAALFLALAFVLAGKKLVNAIYNVLRAIPVIGNAIESLLDPAYHAVMSALGDATSSLEAAIGASWHLLAKQFDWLWRELRRHADLLAYISPLTAGLMVAYNAIRSLAHSTAKIAHATPHILKAITREVNHLAHRVHAIEHDISKGIGEDVLPRIKSLDREVGKIESEAIPAARSAAAAAEADVTALGKWVRDNALVAGTDAMTAAVAVAIGALGLFPQGCSSWGKFFNRGACGLWSALDDLLTLFADVLIVGSICEVIPLLETAFSAIAAPLIGTVAAAGAGLCNPGDAQAPELSVPALSLPTNPGFTLNLP